MERTSPMARVGTEARKGQSSFLSSHWSCRLGWSIMDGACSSKSDGWGWAPALAVQYASWRGLLPGLQRSSCKPSCAPCNRPSRRFSVIPFNCPLQSCHLEPWVDRGPSLLFG